MVKDVRMKLMDELFEAEKSLRNTDHLINISFPIAKENKIILRAFESIYDCLTRTINLILKIEYISKKVKLEKDSSKNIKIFFKISDKYGLSKEDNEKIKNLFFLGKEHKNSGFEFSKNSKIIILNDSLEMSEINCDKVREFEKLAEKLLKNTHIRFKTYFRKV